MRFNAMVHMDSVSSVEQQHLQPVDHGGGRGGSNCVKLTTGRGVVEQEKSFEITKKEIIVSSKNNDIEEGDFCCDFKGESNESNKRCVGGKYGKRRKSIERNEEIEGNEEINDGKNDNQAKNQELKEKTTIDDNNIILYPFAHQVGGHTQLLTLDKGTLCKPLVPRELLFYLNVPKELIKFVPAYKGVVQISEISPGNYQPIVHQPLRNRTINSDNNNNESGNGNGLTRKIIQTNHSGGGSILVRNKSSDNFQCNNSIAQCNNSPALRVQLRPFNDEKVLKKNLSQENLLGADYISRPNEKYLLLLENVASKYELPCILDLKMGTRQHGDDASEEKRHRQIAKCQASTSASLGLRLCGMQVYQFDYGGYLWYDKYYGRKVNEDGLKQALREYFRYNGSKLNGDIIGRIIDCLRELHKAIELSPAFRFYGTSLLIIHESCQAVEQQTSGSSKCSPVDVRLIDFAHTICDFNTNNNNCNTVATTRDNCCSSKRANSSPSILKSTSADQLDLLSCSNSTSATSASASAQTSSALMHKIDEDEFELRRQQQQIQLGKEEANLNKGKQFENYEKNQLNSISESKIKQNFHLEKVDEIDEKCVSNIRRPLVSTKSTPTNVSETMQFNENSTPLTSYHTNNNRKTSCRPLAGPDNGLLFGLENLMRLLEQLKSETIT